MPRTPHRLVRWHRPGTYADPIETDVNPWSRPESEWLGGPQSHQIDIHPDTQLLYAGDSVSSGATPPPKEEDDDGPSDGQQPLPELDLDFYCPILQGCRPRDSPANNGPRLRLRVSLKGGDPPPEDDDSGAHPSQEEGEEEEEGDEDPAFDTSLPTGPARLRLRAGLEPSPQQQR